MIMYEDIYRQRTLSFNFKITNFKIYLIVIILVFVTD